MNYEFHNPVLVEKVLDLLVKDLGGTYVDATIGGGGHSERILQKLLPTGKLIGIDADEDAVIFSRKRFGDRVLIFRCNFSNLSDLLSDLKISRIDGILFDLGISSYQIDNAEKGFSFSKEGILDMRFDKNQFLNARYIVNNYNEAELTQIFRIYGEEKFSRRIAKEIVRQRKFNPINTTTELSGIIGNVVNKRFINKTLARVFQALRIEVNKEMDVLKKGITDALNLLRSNGRIVVISYHSLEDRIVKNIFKTYSQQNLIKILTKKPIVPEKSEIQTNPRSRSAKLRAAEKI
ncbi:MAG: rRNA small subunit methyltransferase H [Ignavibacteriae bacterium]|nr:MAG: rRNA small subunit methyltransferase H [Ignavibacteriota bacterium]